MNELHMLLEQMAGLHDDDVIVGSKTVSWNAYRIAETLNDLEIVPKLFSIIEQSEDELIRKHAFEVLTFILRNTKDPELAYELMSKLKTEEKQDEALYALLMGLWESEVELTQEIESVIYYVDDERDLIRNAAIRLLSKFSSDLDLAKNALHEVIANHYDEYDLRYAKESLKALKGKT